MPANEKQGYFYEKEEQAIIDYINSTDDAERNKIYNTVLHPALTKMIESIIRRYKLFVPDEDFVQTFNDTISYLLSKIMNFKPDKGKKAYSYCGTICKNYLMYKNIQFKKEQKRKVAYEDEMFEDSDEYVSEHGDSFYNTAIQLIPEMSLEIKQIISGTTKNICLNENESKVGYALVELLDNWEDLLLNGNDDSNKLMKSSVLYFLREETMMTTKEVRDNMKKFKNVYNIIKKKHLE